MNNSLLYIFGLIAVIVGLAFLYICNADKGLSANSTIISVSESFENIVVVNGCQYARFDNYYNGGKTYTYTHLGDCTNCWTRLQRLIGKKELELP